MKYDDVEHFVVRCVGPRENRPNKGVLGAHYKSNRNDVMRHMTLFYIKDNTK